MLNYFKLEDGSYEVWQDNVHIGFLFPQSLPPNGQSKYAGYTPRRTVWIYESLDVDAGSIYYNSFKEAKKSIAFDRQNAVSPS